MGQDIEAWKVSFFIRIFLPIEQVISTSHQIFILEHFCRTGFYVATKVYSLVSNPESFKYGPGCGWTNLVID
jgi:hypothetical protein